MKTEKQHIEYFIFDAKLKEIAQNNDLTALEAYKNAYPDCEEIIDQAVLLYQNLKIKVTPVTQEQVDEDYQKFVEKINRKKKITMSVRLSIAGVAACAIIVLSTLFAPLTTEINMGASKQMLSMLDSLNNDIDEIQIISGSTNVTIANNDLVEQTKEGDIVVGKEEKIKSKEIKSEFIQVVVPNGKRASVKFEDGSIAWLNSGTKLVYPKVFAEGKREIFVDGEIYLEVQKSESKTFLVHSKAFDVSVLGTRFNVRAYSEDNENSVVLVDGSVEVQIDSERQILKPEQGLFSSNGSVEIKQVDTYSYTCWKDGIMKVSGETLDNMFMRLSRHYNIKIQCNDSYITREKYRGKLNLHDSLEEVLYNLSLSTPFLFKETDDNTILIYTPN